MGKLKKQSFKDLVLQNKKELLNDQEAMKKIEEKIDEKISKTGE